MEKNVISRIVERYPGFMFGEREYYGRCPYLVYRGNLPRIPEFDEALNSNKDNEPGNMYWYTIGNDGEANLTDYSCGKGSPDYRVDFPYKMGVGWETWGFEYLPAYSGQYNGDN